jgi:ribosomal protein L10
VAVIVGTQHHGLATIASDIPRQITLKGASHTPFNIPYQVHKRILFTSYRDIFESSPLVCVAQHHNLSAYEWTQVKKLFKEKSAQMNARLEKQGYNTKWEMKVLVAKSGVLKASVKGTEVENLSPLLTGPVALLYAAPVGGLMQRGQLADYNLPELAKTLLETVHGKSKMLLLGGKCENNLVTVEGLMRIQKLPGLHQMRSELVGTLEQPARTILSYLQQAPQLLVMNLEARMKDMQAKETE